MVMTRTELKAVDTALSTVETLMEPGREGVFVFTTGDYSSRVASDTQEGIYVASNGTPASSGAWVRLAKSELRASWFGAQGDANASTGAGGTDDTVALNKFFEALYLAPYPAGLLVGAIGNQFKISGSLCPYPGAVVRGSGSNATIWGPISDGIIKPYNSCNQRTDNVVLENFSIDGMSTAASYGILLQNGSGWRCQNILIRNVSTGVDVYNSININAGLDASNYNVFDKVAVVSSTNGFVFENNANSNELRGCRTNNVQYPVIDAGNDNGAVKCQFEVFTTAISCNNGAVSGYMSTNFRAIACRFETGTTAHKFAAEAQTPHVESPHYENVTKQIDNAIATAGHKPQIFGVDGLSTGVDGSHFAQVKMRRVTVNFPSINAGMSADVYVPVAGMTSSDFVVAQATSYLEAGLSLCTLQTGGGFYVRLVNSRSVAVDPVTQTFNCLTFKIVTD